MADQVMMKVTAPLPEGWTKEMVAQHFHNILGIWTPGHSQTDPRNVFSKDSIVVKVVK